MIEEIFGGLCGLMFLGVLLYLGIKYCGTAFKKEYVVMEKREKLIDLMIEKYSVSDDAENEKK